MISEPSRRISSCSKPTALLAASSERKELEQTSSARFSVRCASVPRTGRISCSTTGTPADASCHAASEPARPPPMMCTALALDVIPSGLKRSPLIPRFPQKEERPRPEPRRRDLIAACHWHEILRFAQDDNG